MIKKLALAFFALAVFFPTLAVAADAQTIFVNPITRELDSRNKPKAKMRVPVLPPVMPNAPQPRNGEPGCYLRASAVYKDTWIRTAQGWREAGQGEATAECSENAVDITTSTCILRVWPSWRTAARCSDPVYQYGPRKNWMQFSPTMGVDGNGNWVNGRYQIVTLFEFTLTRWTGDWTRHSVFVRGPVKYIGEAD